MDASQFTGTTHYLDWENPTILSTVSQVAPETKPPVDRARLIHDFVRDQIKFGWTPEFYDQRASDVLRAGVGYCNTKSTLFVAMLRASGIPARQHFVNINSEILFPFLDPGMPFVDHSFAEVYLDGAWRSVDSYVVDQPLFDSGKRQIAQGSKKLGYGIHWNGVSSWDGESDAFSQYLMDGSCPNVSTTDHGVFEDVGAFYSSGKGVNQIRFYTKIALWAFLGSINKRLETQRNGQQHGDEL
jgi:transglutaminase-like putative cysteine protease